MRRRLIALGGIICAAALFVTVYLMRQARLKTEYGVYLSETYDELPKNLRCETLVIDAQNYSASEIAKLKESNGTVISYLSIGSIEKYRSYFDRYKALILGPYENWDEEYWVNVADKEWQKFIIEKLAVDLRKKGVDGFFIDNTDVYYYYPSPSIYDAITNILKRLKARKLLVYVNGGDKYISDYMKEHGRLYKILDGVNQESVFTSINWEDKTFSKNDDDTKKYYLDYLSRVAKDKKKVFLLEYTKDPKLAAEARAEAKKLGYTIYISKSLDL
jgi:uncharacterized protein (TIGR01370 family)